MIFNTQNPKTPQSYINELPISELADFFADAYQADYEFKERDCPIHGKVIDWYGDESADVSEKVDYKLYASYPERYFRENIISAVVGDLALHTLLSNLHKRGDWTIRDCVKKSIMLPYFIGEFKEGVLLDLIGCEFKEIRDGGFEVADKPTQ